MQYLLLTLMLALTLHTCRRLCILRQMAHLRAARRLYLRAAWTLGLTIWAAMLTQEAILFFAGLLTWQTGLPLHLCSLLGVLTLPMLLQQRRLMVSAALFIGLPGAALALLYPAALYTPWPRMTLLAFHTLHAGLVCAPLLPMAMGYRARPRDAALAVLFLCAAGAAAVAANALTGANYLFLSGPVANTPLMLLARWGLPLYRMLLAALALLTLGAEALLLQLLQKRCR